MPTAQELVTAAFKAINAIDINEAAPSPAEMTEGINRFNRMIDGWNGQGLNVADVTMTGDLTSGSAEVEVESTAQLAPGLNVSGTGVPASTRVLTVDSRTRFTMTAEATASGSDVSLTFTAVPFQDKFEFALVALLAQRLAVSPEDVPPWVNEDARMGWQALCANFMLVLPATLDTMLTNMTQTNQLSGVVLDNG